MDKKPVQTKFFTYGDPANPIQLREGGSLPSVTVAYQDYGTLNEAKDNAVLVFHALSGSQHLAGYNPSVAGVGDRWTEDCHDGWWDAFVGPGKALDTDEFYIIAANYLGGCYGSTGPHSENPETGKPYGGTFPLLTFSDILDSQVRLLDHLGIKKLHAAIGASLGGLLALNLATRYPDRVKLVFPYASGCEVSVLQRIHNYEQIHAIENDVHYNNGDYYDGSPPLDGLALARAIAHKTYVSIKTLKTRARSELIEPDEGYKRYHFTHPVESYLKHQGEKFIRRFDANTYLTILGAWQRYDLAKEAGAENLVSLFERCRDQRYLIFSIDSDVCFYPEEQHHLSRILKKARVPVQHITVHSEKGHDAFLLEEELFSPQLAHTLKTYR